MKKIEIRPQKSSGSQAWLLQPGQDWVISILTVHQEIVTAVLSASGQIQPQKNRRPSFQSGGRRLIREPRRFARQVLSLVLDEADGPNGSSSVELQKVDA